MGSISLSRTTGTDDDDFVRIINPLLNRLLLFKAESGLVQTSP